MMAHLITSFKQQQSAPKDHSFDAPAASDTHLPNICRQGGMELPPAWHSTYGKSLRHKLHIHNGTCNPQLDIVGTGRYCVHDMPVVMYKNGDTNTTNRACIYNPDGACLGTLSWERLHILYARFQRAQALGKHSCVTPSVASFEEELA